jgi:hypothetical protein
MPSYFIRPGLAAVAAGVLLLAGCSESSGPSPAGGLTGTQVADLGEAVSADLADLVDASEFNPATGVELGAPRAGFQAAGGPPVCQVSVSPFPPVNSDADAVPDSVRFDFSACDFQRGPMHVSMDGTIDLVDPFPTTTGYHWRSRFTDFAHTDSNTVTHRWLSVRHNGEREVGASPDTLGHLITGFVTEITNSAGRHATHTKDWVAHFTADTPGTIAHGQPLPAGTWTLDGSSTWTKLEGTWSVATQTTVPLHFDPSCTLRPRIDRGQLALVVTRNAVVTNVLITFTACGSYTVTKSGGTS